MKIGLPFLQQIQQGNKDTLGAFTATSLKHMTAAVTSAYHTQHNEDDTHKAIVSTGSITERSRSHAQGVWIDVPPSGVAFSAGSGGGWTVRTANISLLSYMLVGATMTVSWDLRLTSVVSAPLSLSFTISGAITPTRTMSGTFHYNNNGTYGAGRCSIAPIPAGLQGVQITLYTVSLAAWTASSQNTDVAGQFSFEVTGV